MWRGREQILTGEGGIQGDGKSDRTEVRENESSYSLIEAVNCINET